jgi:mannosyltransferase OCH1-like enzyme
MYQNVDHNYFVELDFDATLKKDQLYFDYIRNRFYKLHRELPEGYSPNEFLTNIRRLYNQNKPSKQTVTNDNPIIPNIIHQIWFGNQIPYVYVIWRKKLKKIHSNWKIILWDEKRIKKEFPNGLYNQKTFLKAKKIKNYAKMSNVARYEILYKFGGLYLDCDIKICKSFQYLNYLYNFYAGLENFKFGCCCSNSVIGSISQHPILLKCIKSVKYYEKHSPSLNNWPTKTPIEKEKSETVVMTGSKLFTESIIKNKEKNNLTNIVLPQEYFYGNRQTTISLCTHSYHESWLDRIQEHFNEIQ